MTGPDFDAKAVYGAASDAYEDASTEFWSYLSTRTVDRLALRPGDRVLDVACGTGPATIAAATAVGPSGHVLGVDFAEPMLDIARHKVMEQGLGNVELCVGDMSTIDERAGQFDAVLCVLGLFFVDDMVEALRSLGAAARRPGGRVAVTVFGEHFFDPMRHVFVDLVADIAPDVPVAEPWRRTESEAIVRATFEAAGLGNVAIATDDDVLPLREPADWWRIVLGSGLRHTVAALAPEAASELRARCEAHIVATHVTDLTTRSRYAIARI